MAILNIPTTYFRDPVAYLIFGGISMYEIENPFYRRLHQIYSFLLVSIFGFCYMITEVIHIVHHYGNLEEVTFTLCYLSAHGMAATKAVILYWKRKEISKFLVSLETEIFLPNAERGGPNEFDIISDAIKKTSIQAKVFLVTVFVMLSTRITSCLRHPTITRKIGNMTITSPVLPYPSTLPFHVNQEISPYYELVFIYQVVCIALFGWYLLNTDSILNGLLIHVTAQFKLVANSLITATDRAQRMCKKTMAIIEKQKSFTYTYKGQKYVSTDVVEKFSGEFARCLQFCINDSIKHHHAILDVINYMEETFSNLFLAQFLGGLLCICVGLYQSSLLPITNPTFTSMIMFTFAIGFEILTYCWNGNNLSIESLEICKSAYNSDWICASKQIKESLILIMLRSQKNKYLSAGKFSNISLETFAAIVRGSVSYFTVLRRFNSEQNTF